MSSARLMTERLPAIVLAAGLSSRMGTFKPLLNIGGTPLIHHVIDSLTESGAVGEVIVVTGHEAARLSTALDVPGVTIVYNPQYAQGEMLSSLQAGIAALPAEARGFILAFADQPAVAPATIHQLVSAFLKTPQTPFVLPTYHGRRGHPVVISASVVPEIQALSPDATLRTIVHRHLPQATLLPVNDPAVVDDLDTPEDLARARESWSRHAQTA